MSCFSQWTNQRQVGACRTRARFGHYFGAGTREPREASAPACCCGSGPGEALFQSCTAEQRDIGRCDRESRELQRRRAEGRTAFPPTMWSRILALIALLPALLVPCAVRVCLCTGENARERLECCASCCAEEVPACCKERGSPPVAPLDRSAAGAMGGEHTCCVTLAAPGDWVAAAARTETVLAEPLGAALGEAVPAPVACAVAPARDPCAAAPPPLLPPHLVRGSGLPLLI